MRNVKKIVSLIMAAAISASIFIGVPPAVKAANDTNLKLWYKVEEASGTRLQDSSGNTAFKTLNTEVGVPVTDVTIALSMIQGSTVTLLATITPADASNKTVTFSSSNPEVVTVSEALYNPATGATSVKVKAMAEGNTVISATTSDGNKTAVFHITVVSSNEPAGPTAVLSVDNSVKPGSSFTVGVSLANMTQDVYAEDITLAYDADIFEYVNTSGANNNIQLVTEDKSTAGKVRLIAANIGGISGVDTPVLNTIFKVKTGVLNTSGTIAVTQAKLGVAPQGTVVEAALSSKSISISNSEVVVDKAALIAAITNAQNLYETAAIGTQPGQYPQAAKDVFGAAIRVAQAVKDNANATQIQVDNAVEALGSAEAIFKAAVIKVVSADLNKNGSIDVGDLAVAAYHYGKSSTSADWATAKMADMNGDDTIDIVDISYIASKILE
ncbi:Ig-like domain-containing protein [Paenibacillus chondroitinus]|uniref:Ig-like domain-containing protein n=1 Tax=Paenibacillus chondroitinus TaxID=59842 RepID=A0ABU6DDN3_9BACL|nr:MULTISPECIES: Ig-like domain-containing protein [Paenibacillus]MCY9659882.1 Ig-like domain-containing protein [Paenibacillus anseongense]MEB4795500.1 Ig-like domain-containing protein [Paenibacillus chondroitinus]